MINILWFFLPGILVLGLMTSYDDIRHGKIRNKWVIAGLIYSTVIYMGIISFYLFQDGINAHYLIELGTNFLFAMIVGFGLWYAGIWTAGDGKLFIAFSALIPLSIYSIGYQKWIPSFTLLINIFIPALMIMLVLMLFKIKIKHVKTAIRLFLNDFFQPKQMLNSTIYLFAIYWIMQILLSLMGLGNSYILRLILTILVFSGLQKKLGNKALYPMLMIASVRFAIDKSVYSLSFWVDFLIIVFVLGFIRSLFKGGISKLGQEIFAKELKIDKLKPGMVLSDVIQKKKKLSKGELRDLKKMPEMMIIKYNGEHYIKKPKSSIELDNFIGEEAEGLTRKQINSLKKIGIKKIRVSQTIPFAPFIFLGVVLTIAANGNILILVKNLIYWGLR